MRTTHLLIAGVAAQIVAFSAARADVIEIFEDQPAWESALSSQESIFFTEFPQGTIVWNQYEDLGVLFTDGFDFISSCNSCRDDVGLDGIDDIDLAFDRPRTAIAMDSPGSRRFQLFYAGELIYTSGWGVPPGGETIFLGLLSDQPFDAVRIYSAGLSVAFIDNVFFGDVIPCEADLSGDGFIGPADLAIILGNWGPVPPSDPVADLTGDGVVGPADLAIVLGNWGPCE